MIAASIVRAAPIALLCLALPFASVPSRADEAIVSPAQAATDAARVFAQASALASRMAPGHTANMPLIRFAAAEADAEARALRLLEGDAGPDRVATNEQAPAVLDDVRTGRSVATDGPRATEPPSFADDLPAMVIGLQQLSGERNALFDRGYKDLEGPLLSRLAGSFAAVERTADNHATRVAAGAEVARLRAARAELDKL